MSQVLREHYESVGEIFNKLEQPRSPGANNESETKTQPRFHGEGNTYEVALEQLRHGWPEGASRAEAESASLLMARPVGRRQRWQADVAGAIPNVPAALARQPASMFSLQWRNRQSQGILDLDLYIPVGFNCNVEFDTAERRGVAYVALVDLLEGYGVRCRVTGMDPLKFGWGGGKPDVIFTYKVKDYGEPLALNDLAFMVGHPCFLRRIYFGLAERSSFEQVVESTRGGYGKARAATPADLPQDADPSAVIFPLLESNDDSTVSQNLEMLIGYLPEPIRELIRKEN